MSTRFYKDSEIDIGALRDRAVAVIGYGNQGRAHALNLRDSGVVVRVGQRHGAGFERATADGFEPQPLTAASESAEVIILTLPDEVAPAVYDEHIAPVLRPGTTLGFVHGFNIHYGRIQPPDHVDVIMAAPKGAGYMVRQAFEAGGGLACLIAVHQDVSGTATSTALAWAAGLGAIHAGVLSTTFREETETDLFGEQASVVGGVTAIMKTAFDTLVEAGYAPEHAYLECVHEVKFVVDLIHAHGLSAMRERISDTAEFGDLTRSSRLAEVLRPVMVEILEEIRSGRFSNEWIEDDAAGRECMNSLLEADRDSLLERTGRRLRLPAATTATHKALPSKA